MPTFGGGDDVLRIGTSRDGGFGLSLCCSTKSLMADCSATTEWKTPPWSLRRLSLAKKPSTAFSHEAEVEKKCQRPAWVAVEPGVDLGMLVGSIVVEHDEDVHATR